MKRLMRKVVSLLLTAAMILSLVPAMSITAAAAGNAGTVSSFTIDEDGNFEVTLTGVFSGGPIEVVAAVIPDFGAAKDDAGSNLIGGGLSGTSTQPGTIANTLSTYFTGTFASYAVYVTKSGTFTDGTVTLSGKVPSYADMKKDFDAMKKDTGAGFVNSSGAELNPANGGFPFRLIVNTDKSTNDFTPDAPPASAEKFVPNLNASALTIAVAELATTIEAAARTLAVSNTGKADAPITGVTLTGLPGVSINSFPSNITAGGNGDIVLSDDFAAYGDGTYGSASGFIEVTYSDGTQAQTKKFAVSVTTAFPSSSVTASPDLLEFTGTTDGSGTTYDSANQSKTSTLSAMMINSATSLVVSAVEATPGWGVNIVPDAELAAGATLEVTPPTTYTAAGDYSGSVVITYGEADGDGTMGDCILTVNFVAHISEETVPTASLSANPASPLWQLTTDSIGGTTSSSGGAKPITLTESGGVAATIDSIVSGTASSKFRITDVPASVDASGTAEFKIEPITGLSKGNYTETITITYNGTQTVTMTAEIRVSEPAATTGDVAITLMKDTSTPYTGQAVTIDAVGGTALRESGGVYSLSGVSAGDHNIYVNGDLAGKVTVVVGETATATYHFYTLTLEVGAHGSVVSGGGVYMSGDVASISATPTQGWTHTGWTGGDSTTTVTSHKVTATTTLTATYGPASLTINTIDQSMVFGDVGKTISLSTSGGDGTYTYTTGTGWPTWLKLTDGVITVDANAGTGAVGTYTLNVTATCPGTSGTGSKAITLTVTDATTTVASAAARYNANTGDKPLLTDLPTSGITAKGKDNKGNTITNTFNGNAQGSTADGFTGTWSITTAKYLVGDNDLAVVFTPAANHAAGSGSVAYKGVTASYEFTVTTSATGGSATGHTETITYGDTPTTVTVTIENTGNMPLSNLAITPNTDTTNFTITDVNETSLPNNGDKATFTIVLKGSQDANTSGYSQAVTISATGATAQTYTAKTVVSKKALPTLTWDAANGIVHASTIGGSEGSVTFNNFLTGTNGNILTLDSGATISIVSGTGTADNANGKATGLKAGTYTFKAVAADPNYADSVASGSLVINDGTKYTGNVLVRVDGALTDLGKVTVGFVGNDGTHIQATDPDSDGKYTAVTALDKGNDPYVVHVTTKWSGSAQNLTTTAQVTGTSGDVTATTTVNLYTVKVGAVTATGINDAATYSNTIVDSAAGAKVVNNDLVLAGTTVTFKLNTAFTTGVQDYKTTWSNTNGATSGAVSYNGVKTAVTAVVSYNLYDATGWVDPGVNSISVSGTTLDGKTISVGDYTGAISGTPASVGTFTDLPAGVYTVTGTLKDDFAWATSGGPSFSNVRVEPGTFTNLFTFATTGAEYKLTLSTPDDTGAVNSDLSETWDAVDYGYGTQPSKTVTVTSNSNRDVWVKVGGTETDYTITATTDIETTGVKLEPNDATEFTVTFADAKDATTYAGAFTVTAYEDAACTIPAVDATAGAAKAAYKPSQTVNPIKITAAATTVDKPVADGSAKLANAAVAASGINYKVKSTAWSSGAVGDVVANGTTYTVTVVLEPENTNYEFDTDTATAPLTGFIINTKSHGVSDADGSATGAVTATAVTLTYTFPVTALATPGAVTVSNAAGTNYDAGKFTAAAATVPAGTKYYYVVSSSSGLTLTGDAIKTAADGGAAVTGQVAYGTAVTLSDVEVKNTTTPLTSNTGYYIYVVARAEETAPGTNHSAWTSVATGSFTTWYKLTVITTDGGATNNAATVKVGSTTTNVGNNNAGTAIGVPQASTGAGANVVTLGANTAGRGWKFKNWTTSTAGTAAFGDPAATAANTVTVTGDATITASFHKVIDGVGTIDDGNSFKVGDTLTAQVGAAAGAGGIIIGDSQPANFTTASRLTFQWQYNAGTAVAPDWKSVTGTGNATHAWTVTESGGDILGKAIRVMVTYTGDKDAAGKDSVVYITAASTATKNLGDPSAQALKTAVRGDSGTTGLDAGVLAKGGLYLTFKMSSDDAAANNPVASYQVLVKSGATTVDTYTISARNTTYFDGTDTYKLHIPADTSKVKPTDAGTSVGQYTVEVKAIAETTSGLYGDSGAVTTTAADAGKVVLTTAQLNPTLAGDNDGAIADGDAKFPTVGFDGNGKTATIGYKSGVSVANAGVMTISYKQSSTVVAAPTDPGSYDVYVATAGASYYLDMAEAKLGSFEITAATISAIAPTVTAPAAGGTPATSSVGSSVPGSAKYTITGVMWDPTAVTFGNGKVYTVEIAVAPVTGYKFASDATGKVNNATVPNNSETTGNRLNVASDGLSAKLYYTFPATAPGAPTITDAGATAYNAGKLTELTATSDVDVKFYYQVKLASDTAPATAALVKANATGNLTGTATGSTATWTYTAGQGELTLQANKEYTVYVVAETANNVLSADGAIAIETFKTPYQVTVKADANGSVVIGSDTIAASGSKAYSVYGSQADATANTAATIAHVLTMEPTGTATTGFSKWTGGTPTETVPGGGTYTFTPSVSDTHTLTANFVSTYNVVFDDNGATTAGTLPTTLTGVKVGDEITLTAPGANPVRTGYKTPTHWSFKASTPQASEQYAFGAKVRVTSTMVQGLSAGGNINCYIVWTPEGFSVAPTTVTPTYNTAPGGAVLADLSTLITDGVGPFTYALSASTDPAKGDPTAFVAVSGADLVVRTGTRVGDVKADDYYQCTLTVTDTGVSPNVTQTATITVNVKKATPQITGFTYNTGNKNYWGETVADATKIGGDVTDEMDTATSILADGEWTASPDKFASGTHGDAAITQNYDFTFTVKGAKAGNYNTATQTVSLAAEERDPNIGVATDEVDGTASKTVTVDYDAAVTGTDTVSVVVTNIGNSALNDLDVVLKSGDSPFAVANKDALDAVTTGAELATNGTAAFTITVPKMKDTGTYTAVFTVTAKSGTGIDEKTVSTDYTYTFKVNPATLKAADIEGLTAPVFDAVWDNAVTAKVGGANTGKYVPTVAKWSDGTTDMVAGAKFENGKSYTVTLTLTPNANYVFDIGTDPADLYTLKVGTDPVLTATASGNPKVGVNTTTGVATITYKFKALAPANAGITMESKDYETVQVTELKADSAVDANLYYVILDTANAGLSAAQIKSLATGGSETITGNVLDYGMKLGASNGSLAKWEPTAGIDEIILTDLTGGATYYAYAAAQSAADPEGDLEKGADTADTGKELTVVTTEGGTVSNALLTGGKLAEDSSKSITVPATTVSSDFTAAAKQSGGKDVYEFVKWKVTTNGDSTTNPFPYVYADRATGDTLTAYFAKLLTGTITVANSNSNDAPAVGDVLSPLEGNDLKLGEAAMTNLAGNTSMSYKWEYQAAGGSTWSDMGVTSRTWTVTKGTGGSDTSYVGAAFRVVVTYTESVDGTTATSEVESAPTGSTSVKVDAPEIAWVPTTDGTGGMKLTVTKSDDDNANVAGYEVVVKGDDGSEITVTVTADGSASYEKVFTAAECKPGVEYTVEVVAKAKGTGFANSDKVSAADTAGLVNLELSDLVVDSAGLTDTKDWGNVNFNGYTQSIDKTTITLPTQTGYTNATGALTITYSLSDAANGDTAAQLNAAQYNIYITVADGTYYKGFTNELAGTWTIKQIQATMALTNATGSAQKGVGYNLANQAKPGVTYAFLADQPDAPAYTDSGKDNGTVTSKYTYEYYIKTLPTSYSGSWSVGDKVTSPTAFVADANGDYKIEVKAVANSSATATYQADVDTPASKDITITVGDRIIQKVEILKETATIGAIYGTPGGSYMDGAKDAADAKLMDRAGLVIKVTYADAVETYTVGTSTLPGNLRWHFTDVGDYAADSTDVTAGTGNKLSFAKATSAEVWVEVGGVKSTASDANKHVTYKLDAKKLNYTVDANDKTYGEATSGGSVTINANQVVGNDIVTITATGYTLSGENVGTPTVSATGVALDGANKDFYALGDATNNTITISAATIGTVTVKTQDVVVGDTIIRTIDGTKNKITADAGLDNTKSTITWEKKVGNAWVEVPVTETTFQAGTEYRPVVKVEADSNHKLVVNDNYTINDDKHGANNATIVTTPDATGDKTGIFTGDSTKLAGTPVLKFQDVKVGTPGDTTAAAVNAIRNVSIYTGGTLGSYTITLSNAGDTLYAVDASATSSLSSYLTPTPGLIGNMAVNGTQVYTLDLSSIPTNAVLTGQVIITARGNTKSDGTGATIQATYTFNLTIANAPPVPDGGGGGGGSSKLNVKYDIDSKLGSTKDKTTEQVEKDKSPVSVPTVTVKDAEKNVFVGWTLDPKAEKIKLTNPKEAVITEDTTFYAVFALIDEHEHYIKGYDSGIFAPADNISRAQVAAIIARACLDGFNENNDYGNGGYSDVASDHWAASAIAYCTDKGVFVGVGEGMFEPERSITRQEFALVFARMAGLMNTGDMPFTDAGTTADWAMSGVYTAFAKGWLDGYADGTFKPWNNIARSEAVKIVNRYLNRGVDKNGIANVSGDLKQWPDVPESYWAYYEIIEASNDHTFYFTNGENPPEVYTKAYIEQASWGK